MTISVAETLRQAAAVCGGHKSILVTEEFLLRLAHELEPDYVPPDAALQATRSGFEAVGRFDTYYGHLRFSFMPTIGADHLTWDLAYRKGYRDGRYPSPAIFRPPSSRHNPNPYCLRMIKRAIKRWLFS